MILGPDACGLLLSSSARYEIGHSVRFNSADSAYMNRTPGSAGNRKTWTFSAWVKRAALNVGSAYGHRIFCAYGADNDAGFLHFQFFENSLLVSGWTTTHLKTTATYRDPSAWLHLVLAADTTQATASSRLRLYVNGTEVTAFSTANYPAQNADFPFCHTYAHQIGSSPYNAAGSYFDGYLADVCLIDGQQLTPASFGETGPAGEWRPIDARSIARGTTGFFLGFDDGSSTTTLGYDAGAGTNDWTANNFSVAAGAGNDWLADSPTNNYCTLNPIVPSAANIANGMLDSGSTAVQGTLDLSVFSTGAYWEVTAGGSNVTAGTITPGGTANTTTVTANKTFGFRLTSGGALDYINITDGGAWTSITTGLSGTRFAYGTTAGASWNFGQRAFAGTTSGSAPCTKNLPAPAITDATDYFNVKTYTGTGSSLALTGVGHQPDLVWIKSRSAATDHALYDSVRGVEKRLESNTADDEVTSDAGLTAFGADGFTVNTLAQVNTNAATYASWCWKKGATPGFDIVTYSGNGSTQNVNHSLGVAPDMIIVKARTTASTDCGWPVYHRYIAADAETDYLALNSSSAASDSAVYWNDTAPTSSVFTLGNGASVNASGDTYVAYLFSAVPGFSSFGTFTGNASTDGPFVWLGFRPAFLMVKGNNTNGIAWMIWDKVRNSYNVMNAAVYGSAPDIETTYALIDFLANGFKVRLSLTGTNTYVYAAFAECPFKYANAR